MLSTDALLITRNRFDERHGPLAFQAFLARHEGVMTSVCEYLPPFRLAWSLLNLNALEPKSLDFLVPCSLTLVP